MIGKTTFYTQDGQRIQLGQQLSEPGGEGTVFLIDDQKSTFKTNGQYVVKIYHKRPGKEQQEKLQQLLVKQAFLRIKGICFPKGLVYDNKGKLAGYWMVKNDFPKLRHSVFVPKIVQDDMRWSRIELCNLALRILKRFDDLHHAGILMGDVNAGNILVGNIPDTVVFVDVDSYQFDNFPCLADRPEFRSPRMASDKNIIMRNMDDELYAIATLLFMIFLVNKHPYARRGRGNIVENIINKEFMFPLDYDDTMIPRGPWQRIWYNMPSDIRKAFYNAFKNDVYPTISEWKEIIRKYKEDMQFGYYPTDIFPVFNKNDRAGLFIGNDAPELSRLEQKQIYTTTLHEINDEGTNGEHSAFLEMGTNYFRFFMPHYDPNKLFKKTIINTEHFEFIDANGNIDTQKLIETLRQLDLNKMIEVTIGLKPLVPQLYAFGGGALRMIRNRDEVCQAMKDAFGINMGILPLEMETKLMAEEYRGHQQSMYSRFMFNKQDEFKERMNMQLQLKQQQDLILVDVGGMNTMISAVIDNQTKAIEFGQCGTKTLRNGFFRVAQPDSLLLSMLNDHDKQVETKIQTAVYGIMEEGVAEPELIAMGKLRLLRGIAKDYGRTVPYPYTVYNIELLEDLKNLLTEDLITMRPYSNDLFDDLERLKQSERMLKNEKTIKTERGIKLDDRIEVRLCLPIYIAVMKAVGTNHIKCFPGDLASAFIQHVENKLKNTDNYGF